MLLRYYGVDWAIFLILVIQLWLLGNKYRSGFIFGCLGSILGVGMGVLCESIPIVLMNLVFIFMHIRAWLKWSP